MSLRSLLRVVPITLLLAASAAQVRGQTNEALVTYADERKHVWVAGLAEWVIPIVGHAYAGDASRGIAPAAVSVAGGGLLLWGISKSDLVFGTGPDNKALLRIGFAGLVVGRIWSIVSATQTARDTNAALRERLGIGTTVDLDLSLASPVHPGGGPGLQLALRFP